MQALRSGALQTGLLLQRSAAQQRRQVSASSTAAALQKRVRHIMVSKEKEAVLTECEKQLEGLGKDRSHVFASQAKEHSECASAKSGGDLGWLERGTYFPSFEEVLYKTEVGSLARATTPRGLHLLLVEGERAQSAVSQMSVQDLQELMQNPVALEEGVQFVDVREPWEHEEANLGPKFKLLPLSQASVWMSTVTKDLDPTKHTVCLCHHGVRSMQMATFLSNQGFEQVSNVVGGIDAYSKGVDSSVPEY